MTTGEILAIVMMIGVFFFLATGFPVAFTLTGAALFFGLVGYAFDAFSLSFLGLTANRIFAVMTNEILIAVPLYVYMGIMLERSKVAEQLLETMGQLFGPIRGGLGVSVFVVGALLAASTGIVGATVMAMGLISLPVMLRRGYDPAHHLRSDRRDRHARPDHSALDRAGRARRPDLERQCSGAARARQVLGRSGVGRRPDRRCAAARPRAGPAVHTVAALPGLAVAGILACGAARGARADAGIALFCASPRRWSHPSCCSWPCLARSSAGSRHRPRARRWGRSARSRSAACTSPAPRWSILPAGACALLLVVLTSTIDLRLGRRSPRCGQASGSRWRGTAASASPRACSIALMRLHRNGMLWPRSCAPQPRSAPWRSAS